MASTAPSGMPSSKEKKYDRQLRLWGADGQNKLEASHIALFGASAAGCEILKNLILPGIGRFTIIDDKKVEESDLGVNFFLDDDSVGKSRAERTAALLGELNPDVEGDYIEDSFSNLVATKPELFQPGWTPFTHIIVVSPFNTDDVLKLSPEIPTFLVHSIGSTAMLRISASTRCVVDTHPDTLIDLRLLNPWEELSAMVAEKTKDLGIAEKDGGMSDHEHGHVPYVLLLLKFLEDWKAAHGGNPPSTYAEKNAFKDMIRNSMRMDVPGGSEENYEEAIAAVLKNIRAAEISSHTKAVLEDPRCINPTPECETFWIIAHAVREFMNRDDQGAGLLPLSGGFPDMKAESSTYVALQNIYRSRARRDATFVHENAKAVLRKLGRDPELITLDEVSLFTKHANFVRRINYRTIAAEYNFPPDDFHKKAVTSALQSYNAEWNPSLIYDYVALRAWQEYYSKIGQLPGEDDNYLDSDIREQMRITAVDYLSSIGYQSNIDHRLDQMLQEIIRAGGSELHVIASLIGGIVAQEIVKVITSQYVPVNNTVIFDGIKSRTSVFEF
ncbi:hypothetical protein FN846DRAFT_777021 [Sphaerosporella brunnea]|uniref:NEDD8-activating enzyme E1 regulatory subunit n=1 Tax=Sphaerosporella brunnea TaxID=1250544 RepID=A0A5J5EZQ8_9PEZI|nr:hypothetical protein FN846DRAFT_777021 [Sphaerosporella brunnea]